MLPAKATQEPHRTGSQPVALFVAEGCAAAGATLVWEIVLPARAMVLSRPGLLPRVISKFMAVQPSRSE